MMTTLSLCMIVKNEAQNLERCLKSVQGVIDELIVVDTGSTDTTVEIARAFGARVFEHAWQNDFAEARNFSLQQATGEWILQLDADEELETKSRGRVKRLLAEAKVDGFYLVVRNFLPPGLAAAYDDCLLMRLFRNWPEARFEFAVHEQVVPALRRLGGKLSLTNLQIWHYGYIKSVAQTNVNRGRRNIELLELEVDRDPANAGQCAKLGLEYLDVGEFHLAQGYLRRALDLNDETLSVFMVQDVLVALARLAFAGKEDETAIYYAAASLELLDRGIRSLSARSLLADIHMRLGQQALNAILSVEAADAGSFKDMREHFGQAADYLEHLLVQPELTSEGRANAEARLNQCQTALRMVSPQPLRVEKPTAAETLERLLAADDLAAALQEQADQLDAELRALVQLNAATARQNGETDLADGLDILVAFLDEHLAAAGHLA
jgi:glycosyltransferase involved in cell wall biosynthesis